MRKLPIVQDGLNGNLGGTGNILVVHRVDMQPNLLKERGRNLPAIETKYRTDRHGSLFPAKERLTVNMDAGFQLIVLAHVSEPGKRAEITIAQHDCLRHGSIAERDDNDPFILLRAIFLSVDP